MMMRRTLSRRRIARILIALCVACFLRNWVLQDRYNEEHVHPHYFDGGTRMHSADLDIEAEWDCVHSINMRARNRTRSLLERAKLCRVRNFCIPGARERGGAYVISPLRSSQAQFSANIGSSDSPSDYRLNVKIYPQSLTADVQFIDATVIVWSSYFYSHLSHWLYNGAISTFSVMREFNVSLINDNLLYRPWSFDQRRTSNNTMHWLSLDGRELVPTVDFMYSFGSMGWQQTVPENDVCVRDAIVGNGNRCFHAACETSIPAIHAEEFRLWTLDYFQLIDSYFGISALKRRYVTLNDRGVQSRLESPQMYMERHLSSNHAVVRIVLLNRSGTRVVVNMPELAAALHALNSESDVTGAYFDVVELDLDTQPMTMADVAKLMSTTAILISPHGSGLGNAIWMPPKTTVISLGCRLSGPDWWFQEPFVGIERRLWSWECSNDECTVPNEGLMREHFETFGFNSSILSSWEYTVSLKMQESPADVEIYMGRRGVAKNETDAFRRAMFEYIKDSDRRVSVQDMVTAVRSIADEMVNGVLDRETGERKPMDSILYPELCRLGRCCGGGCQPAMNLYFGRDYPEWNPLDHVAQIY